MSERNNEGHRSMTTSAASNRRLLIVDDNEDIHNDFRRILGPGADTTDLDSLEASLFGGTTVTRRENFELTSAHQGAEAVEKLDRAVRDGVPYALAFVDVRMPPGFDGIETLSRMWQKDPDLQAVICSAHSDYSWDDIFARFGQTDRLLILKKPFDAVEVRQLAYALTQKWNQQRGFAVANHRMAAQYAVTRILVESTNLADAGRKLLEALGTAFDQALGALWLIEDDPRKLRCACLWTADSAGLAEFTPGMVDATADLGVGALGRAAADGVPRFTLDIVSDGDAHLAGAPAAGLHAALHFPLKNGDVVLGVLELLARDTRDTTAPDEGLIRAIAESCAKIAHFIAARRSEAATRRSEAKHRGLLHAVPDVLLRVAGDGTCIDFKTSRDLPESLQPQFTAGRPIADGLPPAVARQILAGARQAAREGTTQVIEYEQQLGDAPRHFEARVAAIEDGEALVLVRDTTERRQAEAAAGQQRAQEETIRAQAESLDALSMPLIPITDDILVMPLVGRMDAARMRRVQEALVHKIAGRQTRVALVDLTGMPSMSPDIGDGLVNIVRAARLLGAEVVLTGLSPDVAITLAALNCDLRGIATHSSLQSGFAYAMRRR